MELADSKKGCKRGNNIKPHICATAYTLNPKPSRNPELSPKKHPNINNTLVGGISQASCLV